MKILNRTSIRTQVIRPLVEFVTARCESPYMAHLVLEQGLQVGMDGMTWKRAGTDATAPSRVQITFGSGTYPKRTLHRKSVGVVTAWDWQEELVHVLAHELRHVDQMHGPFVLHHEVDAERFAGQVLAEFRQERAGARKAA